MAIILRRLYKEQPLPAKPVSDIPPLKADRNREIYDRYLAGEGSMVLARAFGLSDRRVRTIIKHERKRVE